MNARKAGRVIGNMAGTVRPFVFTSLGTIGTY